MKHTRFCFQSKTITYLSNLGAFYAKGRLRKGIFGISGMGIKQEIKKEMPISSLNIHATDVAVAISSFHEGLKMQI